MNVALNIFFIILLFVFQTTILHSFTILGVRPDIVLILTFFICVNLGEDRGAISGFGLGLIQDCLSSNLLGANAFSKGVVGFVFGYLRDKIFFENALSQFAFVLLASLIDAAIISLILFLTIPDKTQVTIVLNKLLLSSAYTTIVAPLFMLIFKNKAVVSFKKRRRGAGLRGQLIIR
ncbi:MAG TPA: rod shape-determining protein MreD [Nitrospinota bacterium]|jgi:rod shape-determining protein MreD|nr:rod shape-determining protein MreD [Nitrospinota bacterium]